MTDHFTHAVNVLNTNVQEEIQPNGLEGVSHEDALMMNVSVALQHLAQGLHEEFSQLRLRLSHIETLVQRQ